MVDSVRYGLRVVTKYSLSEAQAAVLRAIALIAHDHDPVISEADAAKLTRQVNACTDTFKLDAWVFASPLLKNLFCRFPLCFNPPRPPGQAEDGSRRPGNPPAYCVDGVDEYGKPHNDPKYAGRRREALRKQRGALGASAQREQDAEPDDRPVSQARGAVQAQVTEVVRRFEEVSDQVQRLTELAERAGDDDLRYEEIRAVQLEAQESVARESRRRLEAQEAQRAAEQETNRLASELEEAADIISQLTEEAASDRAARDEAGARATGAAAEAEQARRDAEERVAAERERSDHAIATAKVKLDQELHVRMDEMDRRVAAANAERDDALTSAAERERTAGEQAAAAQQAASDARAARDEAAAEVRQLRQENTSLREAALKREREFEAVIAELRAQADHARETHERNVQELRVKHEEVLAARLTDAATIAARVHEAEVSALKAKVEALQARLPDIHKGGDPATLV